MFQKRPSLIFKQITRKIKKQVIIEKEAGVFIKKHLFRSFILLAIISPTKSLASPCDTEVTSLSNAVIGSSGDCNEKLIVNRQILVDAIAAGANNATDYTITKGGVNYTFGDTSEDPTKGDIYTGNITNFSGLFKGKRYFNADISKWNTSNAENMSYMFKGAFRFNRDIGDWNVAKVTNMYGMFERAVRFNQDLDDWDVSSVTTTAKMFMKANKFNQDLNSWDVGSVENMNNMFRGAKVFNGNISSWVTSNVKSFHQTFRGAKAFNQNIGSWNTGSASGFNQMFRGATVFDQDLTSWNVIKRRQKPKKFGPSLSKEKHPCWGSNGCAAGPILSSSSPSDGQVGVLTSATLTLNFDRDVKANRGYIALREKDRWENLRKDVARYRITSSKVTFSADKRSIEVDISNELQTNKEYWVYIKNDVIRSTTNDSYKGLVSRRDLNFTTKSIDSTAPTVKHYSPANEYNQLDKDNPILKLVFTEDINFGTGDITLRKYADDSEIQTFDVESNTDISISDDELTINLVNSDGESIVEADTRYYLEVDSGAIVDKASSPNEFAGISSKDTYNFTTIGTSSCGKIEGKTRSKGGLGYASTEVNIYKANETTPTVTLQTDGTGKYEYYPTEAGTYKVEFVRPSSDSRFAKSVLAKSNGQVQTGRWVKNIIITAACEDVDGIDGLLIDPAGVIYNSSTRSPVSGATVKLLYNGELVNNDWLDSSGGENTQITGSDGSYSFIFKADSASDGTYTIEVEPPAAYSFESTDITAEGTTYTSALGGSVEEIQDQDEAPALGEITTYYLSFSFTFTNESSTTSNGVVNNHIPIDPHSNPTLKADVVGLAEAWTNAAIRFSKSSINAVNRRFDWIRRNQASEKKSHQGIKVSFLNPFIETAVNGTSKGLKDVRVEEFSNWAKANWSNERLVAQSDVVTSDLKERSIDIAMAEVRNKTGKLNLNPTGGNLIGNWSLWTDGQIIVGNSDGTSVSSNQESKSTAFTLGIDKSNNRNGLFGIAFTFGNDDIDVGSSGSRLDSDNYSLSLYSANRPRNFLPIEAQLGVGKMQMDTRRIDNSITHKGNRDVNMIFGSFAVVGESLSEGNFQITPYGKVEAAHIHFEEFAESGSNLALRFKEQTLNRKMVSFGLDLGYEIPFKNWQLRPFGKVEYGHDFTDNSNVDMNYIGDSQNYRLTIKKAASDYWNTALGIEFFRDNRFSTILSYEHEQVGTSFYTNSYQFQINWNF